MSYFLHRAYLTQFRLFKEMNIKLFDQKKRKLNSQSVDGKDPKRPNKVTSISASIPNMFWWQI